MAKNLFFCSTICCALFLSLLSFSAAASAQKQSKNLFLQQESQVASSWISGRKHLEENIIHVDQAGRFVQAKRGSVIGHEDNGEGEEDRRSIYTADYSRVRTHSSPLPKHPKP